MTLPALIASLPRTITVPALVDWINAGSGTRRHSWTDIYDALIASGYRPHGMLDEQGMRICGYRLH
jgi:hypothetical protein